MLRDSNAPGNNFPRISAAGKIAPLYSLSDIGEILELLEIRLAWRRRSGSYQ